MQLKIQAGYNISDDFNGYMQDGFGTFDVTIKDGIRFGAGRGYLNEAKKRNNVNIFIRNLMFIKYYLIIQKPLALRLL